MQDRSFSEGLLALAYAFRTFSWLKTYKLIDLNINYLQNLLILILWKLKEVRDLFNAHL